MTTEFFGFPNILCPGPVPHLPFLSLSSPHLPNLYSQSFSTSIGDPEVNLALSISLSLPPTMSLHLQIHQVLLESCSILLPLSAFARLGSDYLSGTEHRANYVMILIPARGYPLQDDFQAPADNLLVSSSICKAIFMVPWRNNSVLQKTMMLGKIGGRRRRG